MVGTNDQKFHQVAPIINDKILTNVIELIELLGKHSNTIHEQTKLARQNKLGNSNIIILVMTKHTNLKLIM